MISAETLRAWIRMLRKRQAAVIRRIAALQKAGIR